MNFLQNPDGSYSLSKIGTLITGIATLGGTIVSWATGLVNLNIAIPAVITELGIVLALFGFRNAISKGTITAIETAVEKPSVQNIETAVVDTVTDVLPQTQETPVASA